jgi:hypothetical protein
MFPPDRFEAAWTLPEPDPGHAKEGRRFERALGRVPLGDPKATWTFIVWVDEERRLAADWPGFPGTAGARVELAESREGWVITRTPDPALAALADPIPLRRLAIERLNARCMVEYGLAPDAIADFIPCARHGFGIPALACAHVIDGPSTDATVVYGLDGDYPDLFCAPCLARYASGEVELALTVCSRCQQAHLYRHRLVARTWYGAAPPA